VGVGFEGLSDEGNERKKKEEKKGWDGGRGARPLYRNQDQPCALSAMIEFMSEQVQKAEGGSE